MSEANLIAPWNLVRSRRKSKNNKEDVEEVGKIRFNRNAKLGDGVFRGTFEEREVAVKRILIENYELCKRELDLLRKSGEDKAHENIARFFCSEQNKDFYYLALELGQCTVEDWLQTPNKFLGVAAVQSIQLLREISGGVHHLHNLGIVHRDIKPTNILLSYPDNKGHVRAMITDFGLSKKTKDCYNFSMSGAKGSKGWMAPEVLNLLRIGKRKISLTLALDIFSLGCVFYYVLSPKRHPFGVDIWRDGNIARNGYSIRDLPDYFTAMGLVRWMLASMPRHRPSISAVLNHPMFWTSELIFSFFQDASDRLEHESGKEATSALVCRLEQESAAVFGIRWSDKIDSTLLDIFLKRRVYNPYCVKDLLRLIRNVKNHYQDLPKTEQEILGPNSESYRAYFTLRFPKLLLQTWHVMRLVKTESIFLKYYIDDQIAVEEQDINPVMNKSVRVKKPISNSRPKNVSKQRKPKSPKSLESPATERQIQIHQLPTKTV